MYLEAFLLIQIRGAFGLRGGVERYWLIKRGEEYNRIKINVFNFIVVFIIKNKKVKNENNSHLNIKKKKGNLVYYD